MLTCTGEKVLLWRIPFAYWTFIFLQDPEALAQLMKSVPFTNDGKFVLLNDQSEEDGATREEGEESEAWRTLVVSSSLYGSKEKLGGWPRISVFKSSVHTWGHSFWHLLGGWRHLCRGSSGFAVNQRRTSAFGNFCICECVVQRWAWDAGSLGQCFSMSPLLLAAQHSCQPQRVNVTSPGSQGAAFTAAGMSTSCKLSAPLGNASGL